MENKVKFRGSFFIESILILVSFIFGILLTLKERGMVIDINLLTPWLFLLPLFCYYFFIKGFYKKINEYALLFLFSFIFALLGILNAIISLTISAYVIEYILRVSVIPLIGYFFYENNKDSDFKVFYGVIFIIILASAIYGFFTINAHLSFMGDRYYESRAVSFFGHPILFGTFLVFGYPLIDYLFKNKYFRLLLKILFICAAIATQSRSCWIAFILYFIYQFIKVLSEKSQKKFFCSDLLVFVIVFFSIFVVLFTDNYVGELIVDRIKGTSESVSATQRLGAITYVFSNLNLKTFLFGSGINTSGALMLDTTITLSSFATIDNMYVTFFYENGIVVCLLVLFLIFKLCSVLVKNRQQNLHLNTISLCIFNTLVCSFFYDMVGWKNISIIFFIFIGIFVGCAKANGNSIQKIRRN